MSVFAIHNKKLSSCQEKAYQLLQNTNQNIFLTGRAGTGKSFLIREFLKTQERKRFPIVASTGVAAVLIGGRTFHSFFGLGIMEGGLERTIDRALNDRRVLSRLRNINGFVLDEISMISGEALLAAEAICRHARKKIQLPWGGARVIAVGDFSQLPPVNRFGQKRDWAFLGETWQNSDFHSVYLQTMMRTEDAEFLKILDQIRYGEITTEVQDFLNQKIDVDCLDEEATYIFPRRVMAERYNNQRLAQIDAPLSDFPTEYTGPVWAVNQLKKSAPVPENLKLKRGALVMIRVNDPGFQYVNGSVGIVEEILKNKILIALKKGRLVELEQHSFSFLNADGDVVASAKNFPLTLAYAMTIHKSQGVTLDNMVVDLRRLWEPGQAYVALSRLRCGMGLTLMGWDESSFQTDPEVIAFYQSLGVVKSFLNQKPFAIG